MRRALFSPLFQESDPGAVNDELWKAGGKDK
jgi:hypothetical protein